MAAWLVCYDARNTGKPVFRAQRWGGRRVVDAADADAAVAEARRIEGEDWTLDVSTVRLALPAEVARQHAIEHWLTLARQGKAYRGLL